MQRNRLIAAVFVGALAIGGVACSDDGDEEIVPGIEGEGGEGEGEGGELGGEMEGELEGEGGELGGEMEGELEGEE